MHLPQTNAVSSRLRILESAGSTNDVLADLASSGSEPSLSVVLTLDQTDGRGRLGRVWTAPAGKTLAMSVLVRPNHPSRFPFGWLPLIAGAALSSAVDSLVGDGRTGLKWPNDVQIDGRKVCGILAELQPGADAVIVGTGVNLTFEADELPVAQATSLLLAGAVGQGDELVDSVASRYLSVLAELVERLEAAAGDAHAAGIHRLVSEWCRTIGRQVRVSLPDGTDLFGTAVGLDATGRLQVRDQNGANVAVAAGDVTHLRYE